jgi:hypothetical protein
MIVSHKSCLFCREEVLSHFRTISGQMRDLSASNVDVLQHNIYCPVKSTLDPSHSKFWNASNGSSSNSLSPVEKSRCFSELERNLRWKKKSKQ